MRIFRCVIFLFLKKNRHVADCFRTCFLGDKSATLLPNDLRLPHGLHQPLQPTPNSNCPALKSDALKYLESWEKNPAKSSGVSVKIQRDFFRKEVPKPQENTHTHISWRLLGFRCVGENCESCVFEKEILFFNTDSRVKGI